MNIEKKINNKLSDLNPTSIKDINMNIVNMYDTNLKCKKTNNNGFKIATKLKRNFK